MLAHSLRLDGGVLKKGTVLGAAEIIAAFREAVWPGDRRASGSRAMSRRMKRRGGSGMDCLDRGLKLAEAFTGRSNLVADVPGVVRVDAETRCKRPTMWTRG